MTEPVVQDRTQEIPAGTDTTLAPEHGNLVALVHQRLLQEIDMAALERKGPDAARATLEATARVLLGEMGNGLYGETKEAVLRGILDEAIGLGPIQPLVDDRSVSEVMVNSPDEVYFERDGIIYVAPYRFKDAGRGGASAPPRLSPRGRARQRSRLRPPVDRLPPGIRRGKTGCRP